MSLAAYENNVRQKGVLLDQILGRGDYMFVLNIPTAQVVF